MGEPGIFTGRASMMDCRPISIVVASGGEGFNGGAS